MSLNWNFTKKKFEKVVETDDAGNLVDARPGKRPTASADASGVSTDLTPVVGEKRAPYYSLIPSRNAVPQRASPRKSSGAAFWVYGLELFIAGLLLIIAMLCWFGFQVLRVVVHHLPMPSPEPAPILMAATVAFACCFIGGLYLIIGTFLDRNEARPSNLQTLIVSLLPLALYTLIYKASPGYYLDSLQHHGLIVMFVLLWNAIGMFSLFRSRRLGLWALCALVFILPVVLAVVAAPGIMTILQSGYYLVPR